MEKLTPHHSLYLISNDELKEFHEFYYRWKDKLPPIFVNIHNDEDTLAAVLNCWIIFRHYSSFNIKKADKSFIYTCNTYIESLLRDSADIAQIVQLWKNDEDQLFIFSYYLALHILQWIDFVLLNENEEIATTIFKICQRRNYYVHNSHYLCPISDQAIHIKQQLVTSLLTQDNNRTNRMDKIINKAIHEASTFFQIKNTKFSQQ